MKKSNIFYSAVLLAASALPANAAVPQQSENAAVKRQELKTVNFAGAIKKPAKVVQAAPKASLNDFKGRKFYGAMVYSTAWNDLQITEVPYGIYEFTVGDEVTSENKFKGVSLEFTAGAESRGKFYGVRPISMFGALVNAAYEVFDIVNYTELQQRFVGESNVSYEDLASVMCYDYTDNKIYALQYNADLTGLYWSTFDQQDLAFDQISSWREKVSIVALAATPDGNIYGIANGGDFYEIDKTNGRASLIANTGVNAQNYSQSAVYDNRTGTILWNAVTSTGTELYSVDIATGKASYITTMPNEEQVVGTYMTDNLAKDDAPAAISDLKLTYATPGSLSATIAFTLPATTFGGGNLSGNVDYTVYLDGTAVKTGSASAGSAVSVTTANLAEGNHYVAVVLKNTAGYAPYCNLYQYAGYDVPAAVTNLKFEVNGGKSTVTWDTPVGANGGYIDKDKLFYKVYRLPENVLVRDNLKENTFSETLPTEMRQYSYKVVAYNGAEKEGAAAESNKITVGTAFTTPYSHTFATDEDTELYTILDLNNNNSTWNIANGELRIDHARNTDYADDWLITPKIRLQAGKLYRYGVNFRTWTTYQKENLRVAIGKEINKESMDGFTTIADWKDLVVAIDFETKYAEFSVPEDGEYYIGLGYVSSKDTGSLIRLRSVGVEELGNTAAPGKIDDITITPDGDNLKATINFTTPKTDLAGKTIDKLKAVKIYRNEETEPIHTFEAPAVGTKLTWTDENVPQIGVNTYYVVPENENGTGYKSSASAFIGVYQASTYHDPFENADVLNFYTYSSEDKAEGSSDTFSYDPSNKTVGVNYLVPANYYSYKSWIYSPTIQFDKESVYELSFNYYCWDTNAKSKYSTYIGKSAEASAQTQKIGDLPTYAFSPIAQSQEVVITEGGKYNLSWAANANDQYAYVNYGIGNVSLKYLTSALAPFTVENLSVTHDETGALQATVKFNAPTKDYAGRTLADDGITRIDIYRGENGSIPLYTFNNPKPGELLSWLDKEAKQGDNIYMIVPTNDKGRGKAVLDTIFVGLDTPRAVGELKITPDATNQKPTLSWTAPVLGLNGGVVDKNTLVYNVCSYDPNKSDAEAVKVIAQTKDLSYTVDRTPTDKQELCYYAVITQTEQGIGGAAISFSMLGKPYELPYKESFAGAQFETNPWTMLGDNSPAFQWGANPASSMSNYGAEPQDGDDGAAFFYNGNQYEVFGGSQMVSPKIALGGKEATLSFYVWQGRPSDYAQKPQITPMITLDEDEFIPLTDPIDLSEGEPRWVKYTYDLSKYKDASCFCMIFDAKTSGYLDVIFLDNIQVADKNASVDEINGSDSVSVFGVEGGILTRGTADNTVYVYNAAGQLIDQFISDNSIRRIEKGIYMVQTSGKVFKVVVR